LVDRDGLRQARAKRMRGQESEDVPVKRSRLKEIQPLLMRVCQAYGLDSISLLIAVEVVPVQGVRQQVRQANGCRRRIPNGEEGR